MSNLIVTPFIECMLYLMAVYGVYVLFSTLKFFDISTDNVFSFGSVFGAYVFINSESFVLAFSAVIFFGFLVGGLTSLLFSKFRIPKLLAGIITYSVLFSVNIKFFHKPNVSYLESLYNQDLVIYYIIGFNILIAIIISAIFKTKIGKSLLTIGNNPRLIEEFGGDKTSILFIGVGLANSLIACSGFLTSVYFGFSDVNLGVGVLINAVAGIVISESFMRFFQEKYKFVLIFIGMLVYNFILFFVISYLSFGFLDFSDYKIISGIVIVLFFVFNKHNSKETLSLS